MTPHRTKLLGLALATSLACSASSSEDLAIGDNLPEAGKADSIGVGLEPLDFFINERAKQPGLTIITSEERFKDYFNQKPPEDVDFDEQWIVYFGLGARNTGGFGAQVEMDFYPEYEALLVKSTETTPGLDCLVTQAITFPYAMYTFDIPEPRPNWYVPRDETVARDCFTPPEELQQELADSKVLWDELVAENSPNYTYTREFQSFLGFGARTTFVVEDDEVVERHYKAQHISGGDAEAYSEIGDEVGTHEAGYEPVLVEELYRQCAEDVLTKDPQENRLSLFISSDGLMRSCHYWPRGCFDDCSRGPDIASLEFQ